MATEVLYVHLETDADVESFLRLPFLAQIVRSVEAPAKSVRVVGIVICIHDPPVNLVLAKLAERHAVSSDGLKKNMLTLRQ